MLVVEANKPVKNLQVTFRGQTYAISGSVSTVEELAEQFKQVSGDVSTNLTAPNIIWKGKILSSNETLAKAGVQNGDRVLIMPREKQAKGLDVLAMYAFLLSSNEEALDRTISQIQNEQPEKLEEVQEMWQSFRDEIQNLDRKGVADGLRNGFDIAYHRLRSWWEHPTLRQGLHDPQRIESYRQVISTNLSPKMLQKSPRQLQEALKSKEIWRREFSKMTSTIIRLGDTILDGILELLLDVLKGSQRHGTEAGARSGSTSTQGIGEVSDPRMDDPTFANDLLFELSESEEDDGSI